MVLEVYEKLFEASKKILDVCKGKYYGPKNNVSRIHRFLEAKEKQVYLENLAKLNSSEMLQLIKHIHFEDHMIDLDFVPNIVNEMRVIVGDNSDKRLVIMRMWNKINDILSVGDVSSLEDLYRHFAIGIFSRMSESADEHPEFDLSIRDKVVFDMNYVYNGFLDEEMVYFEFDPLTSLAMRDEVVNYISFLTSASENDVKAKKEDSILIVNYLRSLLTLMSKDVVAEIQFGAENTSRMVRGVESFQAKLIACIFDNLKNDKAEFVGESKVM